MEAGRPSGAGDVNPYAAPETSAEKAGVPSGPAHDLTREEVEAFVGAKHRYYWAMWQHAKGDNLAIGFNWAALVFNFGWLLYRRMYRQFFVAMGASLLATFVVGIILSAAAGRVQSLEKLVRFAIAITVGVLGNGVYLRHARREIGAVRALQADPAQRSALLVARGGTSWIPVLVGFAATISLTVLIALAASEQDGR